MDFALLEVNDSAKQKDGEKETTSEETTPNSAPEENTLKPGENDESKSNEIIVEGPIGKSITFDMLGESYKLNLILEKDDEKKNWLNIMRVSGNEYQVNWNIRHPFFKPYIDEHNFLTIMEQFVFALAVTEIEITQTSIDGMVNASAVRMKMNDILKNLIKGD